MKLTWILDQHVDRMHGAQTPFIDLARKRGHTVHALRDSVVPKPIVLDGITVSGPTILRGSHGFVNYVQKELNPYPGGFVHPTNFQLSTYAPIMKELCLNDEFEITTFGEFQNLSINEPVFAKPLEEMKRFSGVVVKPHEGLDNAHFTKYRKWLRPDDSCKIVISKTKKILGEWRFVIVDGQPITASTYDSIEMEEPAWFQQNHVIEFVAAAAKIWNPADAYVMDVAMTDGENKIVEYNQFSTSAMYACNQDKIIDALENLAIRLHYASYA